MLDKLKGAQTVGHSFEVIALPMREVIHGIGVPLVACTDMRDVHHSIEQRIAEEHVGMCHIYLGPQHQSARSGLTAVHELEKAQVLLHRSVAEGAVGACLCGGTLLLGYHLGALFIYIGTSLTDEPHCKVPQLLEVVAGIIHMVPLETQPADVVLDAFDVFGILLHGVGIVEAEVAWATPKSRAIALACPMWR